MCLFHPAIRTFVHFLIHFLLLLIFETLNVNSDMIFKCVKLVKILSLFILIWMCLFHPAIRLFIHILEYFFLLLAIETMNVIYDMIFKCVKLLQLLSSLVLVWMCLSHPAIRAFVHFFEHLLILMVFETMNVNDDMIFKCVHFLVHFLLLLDIETMNVNNNMIFKLVQILLSVVLIWVCLSHPAIRPFVHFLEHFLLLLAIETMNVNDDMIFKCVKLVQII